MEIPFRRRELIVALGGAAAWPLPVWLRAECDAFIRRRHHAGNNAGRLAVRTSVSPRGLRRTRTRGITEHPEHRILLLHAQTCLLAQSDRDCFSIRCEKPLRRGNFSNKKELHAKIEQSITTSTTPWQNLSPDCGRKALYG
jgi:hypothetical protein